MAGRGAPVAAGAVAVVGYVPATPFIADASNGKVTVSARYRSCSSWSNSGARINARRELPGLVVRLLLPFLPQLKPLAPLLGRRFELATSKAREKLGFSPRPADVTLADCGRSLVQSRLT